MNLAFIGADRIHSFCDEILSRPEDDVFAGIRSVLVGRGIQETELAAWALRNLRSAILTTRLGLLTSLGRWLAAKALPDPRPILETCSRFRVRGENRRDGDELCDNAAIAIAKLVLRIEPDAYLAHEAAFVATLAMSQSRLYLAEAALAIGGPRFVPYVTPMLDALLAEVTTHDRARALHPYHALRAAQIVEMFGGETLRAKAFAFAEAALVHGEEADNDVRCGAVELLVRAFGEAAIPALAFYKEPNDALRIDAYRAIATHLGERGLDLLIDGLLYPLDPKRVYGFTTRPKYVAKIFELLAPFDLAPYAARIRKELRGKQLAPQVEHALTGKPIAVKLPKKRNITKGYFFDRLATATARSCVSALVEHQRALPTLVSSIKLVLEDQAYVVSGVVVEGVGKTHELAVEAPVSMLPASSDDLDDDRILPAYLKRYGLDEGSDLPAWGDVYRLPECLLYRELILAGRTIVDVVRERGLDVAPACVVAVGHHDDDWTDVAELERHARDGMLAIPYLQMREELVAICYAKPDAQGWLLAP